MDKPSHLGKAANEPAAIPSIFIAGLVMMFYGLFNHSEGCFLAGIAMMISVGVIYLAMAGWIIFRGFSLWK